MYTTKRNLYCASTVISTLYRLCTIRYEFNHDFSTKLMPFMTCILFITR